MNSLARRRFPTFLRAPAFRTGAPTALAELPELAQAAPDLVRQLREAGLSMVARCAEGLTALLREAVDETLRHAEISPRAVDVALFCSESFDWAGAQRDEILRVAAELGLAHAQIHGLSLYRCANFHAGLRFAEALIRAGDARNILLVVANRVPASSSRVLRGNQSVFGDGVATCLVTAKEAPGYAVESVSYGLTSGGDPDAVTSYLENARAAITAGLGKESIESVRVVIPLNINRAMSELVGELSRTSPDRVYANVAKFGHVHAADNLLNLVAFEAEQRLERDQRALLLAFAEDTWGATLLRRVEGNP